MSKQETDNDTDDGQNIEYSHAMTLEARQKMIRRRMLEYREEQKALDEQLKEEWDK